MKGKATGSCMALDGLGTSFLVSMASHVFETLDSGSQVMLEMGLNHIGSA